MIVYLYAILSCFYASIEGIREAFYYHALKGSKSQNLHGIYWFQRLIFAIFLYVATNFFILTFFVLIFSFFHNGFYFLTRNRLDRLIYPKKFIDFSTTSTIKPQIILHVAQIQNAEYWMDQLVSKGVTDFDIMGLSHYYKWSTVNDMNEIGKKITLFKTKYQKKIMIVETAFPWTSQNADTYNNILYTADPSIGIYPVSKEGQQQYLKELTKQLFNNGGSGIIYWEPAWITSPMRDAWGTGSAWENAAYFDFTGNLLTAESFMKQTY